MGYLLYPLFRLLLLVDHSCQSRRQKGGNISAEPTFTSSVTKSAVYHKHGIGLQ
jgi:hypothetical protein